MLGILITNTIKSINLETEEKNFSVNLETKTETKKFSITLIRKTVRGLECLSQSQTIKGNEFRVTLPMVNNESITSHGFKLTAKINPEHLQTCSPV